jgi:sugar transferase (PEP-CTERM system associated)
MNKKLILGDIILSAVAIYVGHAARLQYPSWADIFSLSNSHRITLFSFVVIFASFTMEQYASDKNTSKSEILFRSLVSMSAAFFILSALYYIMPSYRFGRGVLVISFFVFAALQVSWHVGYRMFIALPHMASRVLILGTGPLANQIGGIILGNNCPHVLTGYLNCSNEPVLVPPQSIVRNGDKIINSVRRERAQTLVVSLSERRGVFPIEDVLECKLNGIDVIDAPSFYERTTGKLMVENTDPSWFIFSDGFKATTYRSYFKRPLDVALSLVGVILCAPLFLLIPALIAFDSKGPVLFRQVRVGEGEKKFVLYKFRTMKNDAEGKTGAVWSHKDDTRITRVGKILRKTRLDEIPQLFNVLKGDMSLIGPRPERPEFVGQLKEAIPYYMERHSVKPGITGWAQVKYPYGASVEDSMEKLRYDLYYIKRLGSFLDFTIIAETVRVVLFGRGGR